MSIEHQGVLLRQYAEEHGFNVVDEYADDGYSGTNFDRPEVQRMLDDAKSGRIDTIIVKDLSRFGRNYIEVGQYIDYIFPAYGIRFIAIKPKKSRYKEQSERLKNDLPNRIKTMRTQRNTYED